MFFSCPDESLTAQYMALSLTHSLSQSVSQSDRHLLILEHKTSHWLSESYQGDLGTLRHLIRVMWGHDLTNKNTMTKTYRDKDNYKDNDKDNPRDNLCCLTIKSYTGQHLQFLRCLIIIFIINIIINAIPINY